MNGWIKIDRRIMEMTGYFGEKFNRTMCWIDLLLLAEWKNERSFFFRGVRVVVKRGQIAISAEDLGNRWGLHRNTVSKRLQEFEEENLITVNRSKIVNVITVVNYEKYQGDMLVQQNSAASNCSIESYKSESENLVQQRVQQNETFCVQQNVQQLVQQNSLVTHLELNTYEDDSENLVQQNVQQLVQQNVQQTVQPLKNIKNNIKENLLTKVQESQTASAALSSPPVGAEALRQEIPYQKIKNLWNEKCLAYPRIITLSDARKHKIQNRIAEMGGTEKAMPILEQLFANMQTSNFLKGDNRRGWKATFDWLFQNDKNWVKVYEGNYDNWTGSTSAESNNKASGNYTVTPDAFTEELAKYINSIPIG